LYKNLVKYSGDNENVLGSLIKMFETDCQSKTKKFILTTKLPNSIVCDMTYNEEFLFKRCSIKQLLALIAQNSIANYCVGTFQGSDELINVEIRSVERNLNRRSHPIKLKV